MKNLLSKEDRIQIALGLASKVYVEVERNVGNDRHKEFRDVISVLMLGRREKVSEVVNFICKKYKRKLKKYDDIRFMIWVDDYGPIILGKNEDYYYEAVY